MMASALMVTPSLVATASTGRPTLFLTLVGAVEPRNTSSKALATLTSWPLA